MNEWISVKTKLPELDQIVLVCFPNYEGRPQYAWGARIDDSDGWLWGIASGLGGHIDPCRDARWNDVAADDDYPVQFWKPMDTAPVLDLVGSPKP